MNCLQLKVFNVGHGLSVMLKELPENYITLFDLGADSKLSPLKYLHDRGLVADQIYITHPHGDHISEIDKILNTGYRPKGFYIQEYDWDDVASREKEFLREKVRTIKRIKSIIPLGNYSGSASFKFWHYTPNEAIQLFGENKYINNSSIAGIFKWRDFKIAILGDLETDALEYYCKNAQFIYEAQNTNILIAPHHGHNSGFPKLWLQKIGKPNITIASIKESDPHICKEYESSTFNKGVKLNGEQRYCLTTRYDGTITIDMYYQDNSPIWSFNFE